MTLVEVARHHSLIRGSLDTEVFRKILMLEYLLNEKEQMAENYFGSGEYVIVGGRTTCVICTCPLDIISAFLQFSILKV